LQLSVVFQFKGRIMFRTKSPFQLELNNFLFNFVY